MNKRTIFIIICIIAAISILFLMYFPSKPQNVKLSLYWGSYRKVNFGIYNGLDKTKTFQWKIVVLNVSNFESLSDEQGNVDMEKLRTALSTYGTIVQTGYENVPKNEEVNTSVELDLAPKELTLVAVQLDYLNLTTYYWLWA